MGENNGAEVRVVSPEDSKNAGEVWNRFATAGMVEKPVDPKAYAPMLDFFNGKGVQMEIHQVSNSEPKIVAGKLEGYIDKGAMGIEATIVSANGARETVMLPPADKLGGLSQGYLGKDAKVSSIKEAPDIDAYLAGKRVFDIKLLS